MKILLRIQLDFICFDFVENFPLYIYIVHTLCTDLHEYAFLHLCFICPQDYINNRVI